LPIGNVNASFRTMSSASAPVSGPLRATSYSAPRARIVDAALALFAERGVSGTSLQMIADAIGVSKAAVYQQYNTKDEIVFAVAEVVVAGLDDAAAAAEGERSRARARQVLIAKMIELAVQNRRMAAILHQDPVMLRFLDEHGPFRLVFERLNRVITGGAADPQSRVRAALLIAGIGGAVIHPLVVDLDDERLRSQLLKQARKLLPARA
jgi:AcrR family transcriptional regulator